MLWQPYICVPCGGAAGIMLVSLLSRVISGEWDFRSFDYWGLGPLVGTVTCAVGCALKAAEPWRTEPPFVLRAYEHSTLRSQRLADWIRGRFADWSGQ